MSFKIRFETWASRRECPERSAGPVFSVHDEHNVRINGQHFLLSSFHLDELSHIAESKEPIIDRTGKVRKVLMRYGVWRVEQRLRDGRFPLESSAEPLILYFDREDMPILTEFLQEKSCAYQVQSGRDVFCSAAMDNDERSIRQINRKYAALTSRTTCHKCNLPDTDLLCSQFLHPRLTTLTRGVSSLNCVARALCAIGRSEIEHPAQCHAGGNACWERVVGPETDRYLW
jgi:hypothetical protein